MSKKMDCLERGHLSGVQNPGNSGFHTLIVCMLGASKARYSGCPNTGRPVFGYFHLCPVDKTSGFRVITRKPDVYVRFSGRPVPIYIRR